jgi:hypothetical protein
MPILLRSSGSRIVPIGSILTRFTRKRLDLENLQSERNYNPKTAYIRSKQATELFGFELDRRLRAAVLSVQAIVVHPGGGLDGASPSRAGINEPSPLSRVSHRLQFLVAQGKDRCAWTAVRAAADPAAAGGQYYGPAYGGIGKPVLVKPPARSSDAQLAERLWTISESLTGIRFHVAGHPA